jgi:FMN phosphatase YigB (HAD superfamily)
MNTKNTKIFAWDQGGVLFTEEFNSKFKQYLSDSNKIGNNIDDYQELRRRMVHLYTNGSKSIEDVYNYMGESLGIAKGEDLMKLQLEIEGVQGVAPEMVSYLWEVADQGYTNTYFTNGRVFYLEFLQVMEVIPKFVEGVASEADFVWKPDINAYEMLWNKLSSKVEDKSQILFIDDKQSNLRVGKKFGFSTHLYSELKSLIDSFN